jgi:hypothetical protein
MACSRVIFNFFSFFCTSATTVTHMNVYCIGQMNLSAVLNQGTRHGMLKAKRLTFNGVIWYVEVFIMPPQQSADPSGRAV